jgi:hypothetical protein
VAPDGVTAGSRPGSGCLLSGYDDAAFAPDLGTTVALAQLLEQLGFLFVDQATLLECCQAAQGGVLVTVQAFVHNAEVGL